MKHLTILAALALVVCAHAGAGVGVAFNAVKAIEQAKEQKSLGPDLTIIGYAGAFAGGASYLDHQGERKLESPKPVSEISTALVLTVGIAAMCLRRRRKQPL